MLPQGPKNFAFCAAHFCSLGGPYVNRRPRGAFPSTRMFSQHVADVERSSIGGSAESAGDSPVRADRWSPRWKADSGGAKSERLAIRRPQQAQLVFYITAVSANEAIRHSPRTLDR